MRRLGDKGLNFRNTVNDAKVRATCSSLIERLKRDTDRMAEAYPRCDRSSFALEGPDPRRSHGPGSSVARGIVYFGNDIPMSTAIIICRTHKTKCNSIGMYPNVSH